MTENQHDSATPATGMSVRTRWILVTVAAIVLICLIVWFIQHETYGKYQETTDDAFIKADSVTVSPKVSGYVAELLVADNQAVKAGQPLVRIDPRDYRAQTAQYEAQIDVAGANAANARAGIAEQQAEIAQARAQLATAQANARFAAGEVDRYAPLVATGAETREKLTNLRNQAAQTANAATAQAAATHSAELRVASLQAQLRQAQAQGEAAQAQRSAADVNLNATVIRAPVDGRVGDKSVQLGQFVGQGSRLMSVVPVQAIYITANFKETQLGLMRPGQPAKISVDALPGVAVKGHVESLAPGTGAQFSLIPPQNATGNFTKIVQRVPVRIAIDAGPDVRKLLFPGLSVKVTVDTIGAKGAIDRIRDQQQQAGQ